MRRRLVLLAALLCALPASGDGVQLSDDQLDALTTVDAMPTRPQIDLAFGQSQAVAALIAIARDAGSTLDLQVRAIRTLPQYCDTTSCSGPVHDALVDIVTGYRAELPGTLSPQDLLRLRAAVEALGATRSGLASDVDLLTAPPLLHHPVRDVQVATVHALRDLCSPDRCDHATCTADAATVRALRTAAGDTQLDAAINSALQDLALCDQP